MRLRHLLIALIAALALALPAAAQAQTGAAAGATVTGRLTGAARAGLAGMAVEAVPQGADACTAATGCVSTYTRADGAFTLTGAAAGTDDIDVVDGLRTVTADVLAVPATGATPPLTVRLGPPAVPTGTAPHLATRALGWLNAERRASGLGAVLLNPRWSAECAAHDAYEVDNRTLQAAEDPAASGYSVGGSWAGLSSDLAAGRWTAGASPWLDAPVNLLALLAPSLAVTGIDDGPQRQCAITFPGMLRPPPVHDTIATVPAAHARDVPTSELARESPFTPVQFVGLSPSHRTGRELFVYLNRTGELGQAPVQVVAATLRRAGRPVSVRVVDAGTRTLGRYLAGAIIIPVDPLRAHATYQATVRVRDGARTLTHAWSFQTGD